MKTGRLKYFFILSLVATIIVFTSFSCTIMILLHLGFNDLEAVLVATMMPLMVCVVMMIISMVLEL